MNLLPSIHTVHNILLENLTFLIISFLGEGHTDPYSLTQALAIGARKWGAEIYLSSPVQALSQKEDGTWDVQTPHGMINAKHVVNASGMIYLLFGFKCDLEWLLFLFHQFMLTIRL